VRRALVLAPLALVCLAACGGSSHATTTATTAVQAKRLQVVIVGQDHHPLVNKRWHYEVRVTANGKPVVAFHVHLQFLFAGSPVGEVGVHNVKGGVWRETFGTPGSPPFPPASRGQALVLQAIVTVKGYPAAKARWAVTPR
jgi:hypothetical protein